MANELRVHHVGVIARDYDEIERWYDAMTVRRQILVNAPIGEVLKAFSERFGDFRPREHNLLREPISPCSVTHMSHMLRREYEGLRVFRTDRNVSPAA